MGVFSNAVCSFLILSFPDPSLVLSLYVTTRGSACWHEVKEDLSQHVVLFVRHRIKWWGRRNRGMSGEVRVWGGRSLDIKSACASRGARGLGKCSFEFSKYRSRLANLRASQHISLTPIFHTNLFSFSHIQHFKHCIFLSIFTLSKAYTL